MELKFKFLPISLATRLALVMVFVPLVALLYLALLFAVAALVVLRVMAMVDDLIMTMIGNEKK